MTALHSTMTETIHRAQRLTSYTIHKVCFLKNGEPVECFVCKKNHLKKDCPIWKARNLVNDEPLGDKPPSDKRDPPASNQVGGGVRYTTVSSVDIGDSNWEEDYDLGGIMLIHKATTLCGNTADKVMAPGNDDTTLGDRSTDTEYIMKVYDRRIDPWHVLLDNQSTVNVFYNPKILKNIRTIGQILKIFSTGGVTFTNLVGDLQGYGTVWFCASGIENILSLSKLKTKYI